MKHFFALISLAVLLLVASSVWACDQSPCHDEGKQEEGQLVVPGDAPPVQNQPKLRSRGFVAGDEAGENAPARNNQNAYDDPLPGGVVMPPSGSGIGTFIEHNQEKKGQHQQ